MIGDNMHDKRNQNETGGRLGAEPLVPRDGSASEFVLSRRTLLRGAGLVAAGGALGLYGPWGSFLAAAGPATVADVRKEVVAWRFNSQHVGDFLAARVEEIENLNRVKLVNSQADLIPVLAADTKKKHP